MALMTDERRKEMEEEMNRFEQEIAVPGEGTLSPRVGNSMPPSDINNDVKIANDKSSMPLQQPPVLSIIPEVLNKAPPPPPEQRPQNQAPLQPPPAPPQIPSQPRTPTDSVRFIPHQIHRQPRPPMRPNFMGMRGPMPGPHGPFPHPMGMGPGPGHFGPQMGQGPPGPPMPGPPGPPGPHMGGPPIGPHLPPPHMPPGGPMHHGPGPMPMHPGPMSMPPCPPMPHPMGNMNMNQGPSGFCPTSVSQMGPMPNITCESQSFMLNNSTQDFDSVAPTSPTSASNDVTSTVSSGPAIYAAPFMKNEAPEVEVPATKSNQVTVPEITPTFTKPEKVPITKPDEPIIRHTHTTTPSFSEEVSVSKKKEKKKKIVRMAGGQAWEDNSLLDWESDDFRIFCGDLGNDVTDEVLIRAFSKYNSFLKAKVIRDKRTNKTKGYGFVSFKDPQDFIKAMREMNGRYVGSRPIKLRKSTWRDRNIDIVKKKQKEKEKLGLL